MMSVSLMLFCQGFQNGQCDVLLCMSAFILSQYEAEKYMPKHMCAHLLLQREQKDEAASDSEKFSYCGVEGESEGKCCQSTEQTFENHSIMACFHCIMNPVEGQLEM